MALDADLYPAAPVAQTRIPQGRRVRGLTYGAFTSRNMSGWEGYYVAPLPGRWLISRTTPAADELVGTDAEILAALRSELDIASAAAILGRKGGSVVGRGRGASKVRGDSEHYRQLRAKRRQPQTYTSDGERGGYTAREGLRGWVVEGWSRVAGERTGWRCLVSYAPPFEPSLRLDGLASGPGGAVVHAEMIYEAASQAIAAGAPVGKALILGVRVLRRGHVVR